MNLLSLKAAWRVDATRIIVSPTREERVVMMWYMIQM